MYAQGNPQWTRMCQKLVAPFGDKYEAPEPRLPRPQSVSRVTQKTYVPHEGRVGLRADRGQALLCVASDTMARRSELSDRYWRGKSISRSQGSYCREAERDVDPSVLIPRANPCPTLPTRAWRSPWARSVPPL